MGTFLEGPAINVVFDIVHGKPNVLLLPCKINTTHNVMYICFKKLESQLFKGIHLVRVSIFSAQTPYFVSKTNWLAFDAHFSAVLAKIWYHSFINA